jgi:hypothetical protein
MFGLQAERVRYYELLYTSRPRKGPLDIRRPERDAEHSHPSKIAV